MVFIPIEVFFDKNQALTTIRLLLTKLTMPHFMDRGNTYFTTPQLRLWPAGRGGGALLCVRALPVLVLRTAGAKEWENITAAPLQKKVSQSAVSLVQRAKMLRPERGLAPHGDSKKVVYPTGYL